MNQYPSTPMAINIAAEAFKATEQVRQCHLDYLLSVGIPSRALAVIGADRPGIGVMAVRELSGSLFEPAAEGQPHLIVPVCAHHTDAGVFVPADLIAMRTSNPRSWLWRFGSAWALGAENLGRDAPLRVVPTPLQWIAAEGRALCILDWCAPRHCWQVLRSEMQLILPDEHLRKRLSDALTCNQILPDMVIADAT